MDSSRKEVVLARRTQGAEPDINARLVQRVRSTEVNTIEAAGRNLTIELYSPEAKRLFLRHFNAFQRHMHFISVVARHALRRGDIDSVEVKIKAVIDEQLEAANAALSRAETTCRQSGITSLAVYAVPPLTIDVTLISPFSRSLHELILKIDQLMPMLETLALDQISANSTVFSAKSGAKRWVRRVVGVAREQAGQLGSNLTRDSSGQNSTGSSTLHQAHEPVSTNADIGPNLAPRPGRSYS